LGVFPGTVPLVVTKRRLETERFGGVSRSGIQEKSAMVHGVEKNSLAEENGPGKREGKPVEDLPTNRHETGRTQPLTNEFRNFLP